MPNATFSSAAILACVVEAGCVMMVRESPQSGEIEAIFKALLKATTFSKPPLISKVNIHPPYFI
jgi:hypothetical protein